MDKTKKAVLVLLRISLGWLFFYAGITKILNPEWSAVGFLNGAQSLETFYGWLASESNIVWVDFLNEWGLTLIGTGLILGAFTKAASVAGALLMTLYYFPSLEFPHVGHGYLVDDHIIYILVFALLYLENAGRYFGLDKYIWRK